LSCAWQSAVLRQAFKQVLPSSAHVVWEGASHAHSSLSQSVLPEHDASPLPPPPRPHHATTFLSNDATPGNVSKRQTLPAAHSAELAFVEQHVSEQYPLDAQSPERQSRLVLQAAPPCTAPNEERWIHAGLTQKLAAAELLPPVA
jgi:hypothetical protein